MSELDAVICGVSGREAPTAGARARGWHVTSRLLESDIHGSLTAVAVTPGPVQEPCYKVIPGMLPQLLFV